MIPGKTLEDIATEKEIRAFYDIQCDEETPDIIAVCAGEWRREAEGNYRFYYDD